MTVSSSRVVSALTAAAVVAAAGLVSLNSGGASAQPTTTQPTTTKPTQTQPTTTKPTQPVKPAPPPPTKPGDTAPPPPPPPSLPGPDGEKGPDRGPGKPGESIGDAMSRMDRAIKQLQRQVGDTKKKDDTLRIVSEVQRNCLAAKAIPVPPEMLEKIKDEAEKTKVASSYRKRMVSLMRKLLDLEMFVLEGKTDAANAKVLDIMKFSEESHEEFGEAVK
ncbi:MAG: hypothetical protein H7210_11995 [Pyrinomonadaceae bacterium]|nr:hypothetical protein [Phycisphaerales bacterium]